MGDALSGEGRDGQPGARVSRRDVLKLGAATAAAVGVTQLGLRSALASAPLQAADNGGRPAAHGASAGGGFKIDIQGCPVSSANVDALEVEPVVIATVEKNPVIRFSLEKIMTPTDLHAKKSSQFLSKTLGVMVSGAAMLSSMACARTGIMTLSSNCPAAPAIFTVVSHPMT